MQSQKRKTFQTNFRKKKQFIALNLVVVIDCMQEQVDVVLTGC